jgi:hypothetical protein
MFVCMQNNICLATAAAHCKPVCNSVAYGFVVAVSTHSSASYTLRKSYVTHIITTRTVADTATNPKTLIAREH